MKRFPILLGLSVLLSSCGSSPDVLPSTNTERAQPVTCLESARVDRVDAATWNMAIGFDVSDLLFLNPDSLRVIHERAQKLHDDAVNNLPRERVRLIAQEIARTTPEIVGLQETMRMVWNGTLVASFLDTLMSDLRGMGANYTLVASPLNHNTLRIAPIEAGGGDSIVLEFAEGNAFLVGPRWSIVDTGTIHYRDVIPVDMLGLRTVTDRAAQWAALRDSSGFQLEVWNTHLEVLDAQTIGQAGEFTFFADSLRAALLHKGFSPSGRLFLGDINSLPGSTVDSIFLRGHWNDSWDSTRFGTGYTYGSIGLRDSTHVPTERLDYLFHQGGCGVDTAWVGGITAQATDSGPLFPSDHGVVHARIRYGVRK
jgi:endonuclease/exonuclease/phosphatase family metal-dependent hydrolase